MATMMAIVSKAVFEKQAKRAGKLAGPGDVLPLDRYVSKSRHLSKLGDSGTLFLLTVRPPDEALWLVAILERVAFSGDEWVAASPNIAPITNITDHIPEIRFTTGKGIQAKPGKLGMSLQTPRELTADDVALLRRLADVPERAQTAAPAPVEAAAPAPVESSQPLLERLTADRWLAATSEERATALAEAAHLLGADFTPLGVERFGGHGVGRFRHVSSGAVFSLVPGGEFEVGLGRDELSRLMDILDRREPEAADVLHPGQCLRPARPVRVAPFLLSAQPLTSQQLAEVTGRSWDFTDEGCVAPDEVAAVADALAEAGFRLPSEAEWEHAARAGHSRLFPTGDAVPKSPRVPPNEYGVAGQGDLPEICADGWHESARSAPRDARPRQGSDRVVRGGAGMLYPWQGCGEWTLMLCSARHPLSQQEAFAAFRPARSLFDDADAYPAPPPTPADDTAVSSAPRPSAEYDAALVDVRRFETLGEGARQVVAARVAQLLGDGFQPTGDLVGEARLPTLRHRDAGVELVLVPGGTFAMGFTVDDALAVLAALPEKRLRREELVAELGRDFARARPPRVVTVGPLVVSRRLVDGDALSAVGVDPSWASTGERSEARQAAEAFGGRLLSEAEWEWLARAGGASRWTGVATEAQPIASKTIRKLPERNAFGLEELQSEGEWVSDDWHPSYLGAPADTCPWLDGGAVGTMRIGHVAWRSDVELVALHAAYRCQATGALPLRVAWDLDLSVGTSAPELDLSGSAASALSMVRSTKAAERRCGLLALGIATEPGAADAPVVLRGLAAAIAAGAKDRDPLLCLFGDVAAGDSSRGELMGLHPTAALPDLSDDRAQALREAVPTVVAALPHRSAKTRAAAAFALAPCPPDRWQDAALAALEKEKQAEVRASLTLALGFALDQRHDESLEVVRAELTGKSPVARAAAAIALGLWYGTQAPDPVVEALAAAAGLAPVAADKLPWRGGRLAEWAVALLSAMRDDGPALAARTLATTALRDGSTDALNRALELLFEPAPPFRDAGTLSPAQRQVLETLSSADASLGGDFERFGIPARVGDRRRWLGLDPPGYCERLLDGVIAGETVRLPVYQWTYRISEDFGPDDLEAMLESQWSPVDRLGLAVEARLGRYALNVWVRLGTSNGPRLPSASRGFDQLVDAAIDHDTEAARSVLGVAIERELARAQAGLAATKQRGQGFVAVNSTVTAVLAAYLQAGGVWCKELNTLIELTPKARPIIEQVDPADREALFMRVLGPAVERAKAARKWYGGGLSTRLEGIARLLDLCPTRKVAIALLKLRASDGQPQSGRAWVAEHGGGTPAVDEVLAEYDAWPDVVDLKTMVELVTEFPDR